MSNSTAAATVSNAANTVGNFFSGLIKDYATSTADIVPFVAIANTTATGPSLSGSVQWDTTGVGLNYVSLSLSYSAPASTFADGTNSLVWFQVEKPVFPAGSRLLQAATNTTKPANSTNTTAPMVTGTGDYEGQALVFTGPDKTWNTTNNVTAPAFDYNFVGKTSCVGDKSFYTAFCGKTATATVAASYW
jgi:hypothetical protein